MSYKKTDKKEKMPPPPDKWKDTTAYVRWLLEYHWLGAPKVKKRDSGED